jgi:hypothetical protein
VSPDADMELIGEYDEIEIPPVKPYGLCSQRNDLSFQIGPFRLFRARLPATQAHQKDIQARAAEALFYETNLTNALVLRKK